MPNHLTPEEVGERVGLSPAAVLEIAHRLGVPVFHGRIDVTLFETARAAEEEEQG